MAIKLFGFTIGREEEKEPDSVQSFALPDNDDGAVDIAQSAGAYGQYIDLEGLARLSFIVSISRSTWAGLALIWCSIILI